jgi:imidazolonepropionase-like amidohydrolase
MTDERHAKSDWPDWPGLARQARLPQDAPRAVASRWAVRVAAVALATSAALPARAQGPPVTAFVGVSVVPMDTERVLPHQTVLVAGGRITALGPDGKVRVPPRATRVDGRGKFLIPDLADMHAHSP